MTDIIAAGVALNLLAAVAAGAFVFLSRSASGASPLDQRLRALFALFMALFCVRTARWALHLDSLTYLENALAALLPLFSLFVAEGLLRRHAPSWMKAAFVIGALALFFGSLFHPANLNAFFSNALGGFVVLGLLALAAFLAFRDQKTLAPSENRAIGALFVGVVFAAPFAASDFLVGPGVSPFYAGGLAPLVFSFALVHSMARSRGAWSTFLEIAASVLIAALGAFMFAFVFRFQDPIHAMLSGLLIFGIVLVSRIGHLIHELLRAQSNATLWRAFAEAPSGDLEKFIDFMLGNPILQRARLLQGAALSDFDEAALISAFGRGPIIATQDTRTMTDRAGEQLSVLFEAQEATHCVLLTRGPLRLLFVNFPRVGAGVDAELQLKVLAKLAAQAVHA